MAAESGPGVLTFSPPVSRRRRDVPAARQAEESRSDDDRLAAVNRALARFGLPKVILGDQDSVLDSLQALLEVPNVSFASHQQESAHLERIGRLEAEKDVLQQRLKQLTVALDVTERESAQKEEKMRAALSRAAQQQRTLEAEKAELSKEVAVLQHRDNQYLHEVRKKERDLEKIQKKLQAALGERGVKDTRGIELHATVRVASANKTGATELDLLKRTVHSLEERSSALMAENDSLRSALQELSDHVAQQEQLSRSEGECSAAEALIPQIVLPPLDAADSVQHLRAQVWQRIEQLKANLGALESRDGDVELASLQQQVNELRRIIVEQERLLHFSLNSESAPSPITREAEVWASPALRPANSASNTPTRPASEKRALGAVRPRRQELQENRAPGVTVNGRSVQK